MNTRDQYTDELVSAYFDGELSADERTRVERLLSQGGPEQHWLEEIESLRDDLQLLPSRQLGAAFTQRTLQAAQDAAERAGLPKSSPAPTTATASGRGWVGWAVAVAGLAATLLLAFAVIHSLQDPDVGPSLANQLLTEPEGVEPSEIAVKESAVEPSTHVDDSRIEQSERFAPVDTKSLATGKQPPSNRGDEVATERPAGDQPVTGDRQDAMRPGPDPKQVASDDAAGGRADAAHVGTVPDSKDSANNDDAKMASTAPPVASGQLLMVFDVTMTRRGQEEGRFDRALLDQQISFDATLTVDEDLEATLMRSRFLDPADEVGKPDEVVQMVYVVTRGGKIDEIWQAMRESEQFFSQVKCDLAIMPADQEVFRQLRRTADAEWAARDATEQNLVGGDLPGNRTRAQRLVLPQTWKGVPAHRLGRMGLMPQWTQQEAGGERLPEPARPAAPPLPVESGHRLGENIVAEALFVITMKRQ